MVMLLNSMFCARSSFHDGRHGVFSVIAISTIVTVGCLPGAASSALAANPGLRYRFQEGRTYVYEVKITADLGDVRETREGLSIYEVKSATSEKITLAHSGSLSASRKMRDGEPLMFFPSPFMWSGGVTARESEMEIDAAGDLVDSQHLTPLPFMLGDFQVLVIEPLSQASNSSWKKNRDITIVEKEASNFPPVAFGPFGQRDRGVHRSAKETISYSIAGSNGRVTRIKRTYSLRTDDQVDGNPRLAMNGAGELSFDMNEGVMKSQLTKYSVEANEDGKSVTIPVTVDYRLLGPDETAQRLKEVAEKKAAMPRSHSVETTSVPTTDSPLGGGSGGGAFRFLDPDARAVIGVRYQLGSWGGEQTLGHLEPLYTRDPVTVPWQTLYAKEGYALGAMQVSGTKYVNAVRLAFMKLDDDKLDMQDRYLSQWIGTPTSGSPKSLFSEGQRVLGLHGKRAAILDAIGLVFEAQ